MREVVKMAGHFGAGFICWFLGARSQNFDKLVLNSSCLSIRPSVRLSVRVEQLGYHSTDFDEI